MLIIFCYSGDLLSVNMAIKLSCDQQLAIAEMDVCVVAEYGEVAAVKSCEVRRKT